MKRSAGARLRRCRLAYLMTAISLALAGCGTTEVREVNKAAVAAKVSYTDEVSRLLAQKSLAMLKERATDYCVGPEDVLEISIFEWELSEETRTVSVRVAETGVISLPVIGEISVAGVTVEQTKQLLETRLIDDGILKEPRVSVVVREFRSKRVAVVGAVNEPGVYTLRQNVTTLLAALSLAGGATERAGQVLYIIRTKERPGEGEAEGEAAPESQKQVIAVDLYELLEEGNLELNVVLQDGDVVQVPEATKFYVVGFVQKPGGFPLTRPTTILEGIALAGGLREREASASSCILKRHTREGEVQVGVDLVAISRGEAPNLYLIPNDVMDVRQTFAKKVGLGFFDAFKTIFNVGYTLNPR